MAHAFRLSYFIRRVRTRPLSANIYPATAHLPHIILLIDAVSSHAPIRTAPTARTMRRPPAATAAIPGISSICAVLCFFFCFCFVLALDPCSLLLIHLSKSCCLGGRPNFHLHFHNLSARFARPACRSFSIRHVLQDHSMQETCSTSKEFIKQVASAARRLTMHYDVWPPQLRVSSRYSHLPGKSVACVNVARKPRRIKQVAASIAPHHFPPQHQLRRQL